MDKYNDTEHTTTEVTPNYAATDKYNETVKKNIEEKAQFNRKYDKVNEGDLARVYKNPENIQNSVLILTTGKKETKK